MGRTRGRREQCLFQPGRQARRLRQRRPKRAGVGRGHRGGIGNPLIGHWDLVVDAVFTPDNLRVLSGSRDGTIRTWPLPLDGYGAMCAKLTQNPSQDQWLAEMPQGVDYKVLCPDLPVPGPR